MSRSSSIPIQETWGEQNIEYCACSPVLGIYIRDRQTARSSKVVFLPHGPEPEQASICLARRRRRRQLEPRMGPPPPAPGFRLADAKTRGPVYAAATVSGTCAFMTTAGLAQALQLRLGVHTGTSVLGLRVLPSLLGACTVAVASVASVEAAAWAAAAAAAAAVGERVPLRRARATHGSTHASSVLLGYACFLALRGRFWALSPSSLSTLGAFANTKKGSLPATLAYATSAKRAEIQQLGRRFGCHTCGARPWPLWGRPQLRYNADHMPPLAEVKVMNKELWRRVLSAPARADPRPSSTLNL